MTANETGNCVRAFWVKTEALPDDEQRRAVCLHYMIDRFCAKPAMHRVTVRVRYENCCEDRFCLCGSYADIDVCETHSRGYERAMAEKAS